MWPKVRGARARCSDPGDGALVDLYRDRSVAPLVDLRRRLKAVLDVIAAIGRSGFTVSRGLELTRQWGCIVAGGPQGTVTAEAIARVAGLGLADMEVSVADLHHGLDIFLQSIVRHRKERAVVGWKAWILEDPFSGIGIAGCCVYAHVSGAAWFGRMRGHLDLLPPLQTIVPYPALCILCSELRFGEFWLPCKVVSGCMLVWKTLTWLITSLVFLLVDVPASLFL